jgi:hypothetical protein
MFCPQCRAEYRPGFTHCTDCDVDLVEALPASETEVSKTLPSGSLEILWEGDDLALFESLLDRLEDAGIRHFDQPLSIYPGVRRRDNFPVQPLMRFGYQVAVLSSDLVSARQILERLLEEEPQDMELPAQDEKKPEAPEVTAVQEGTATCEVWSGSDESLVEFLAAGLKENGIQTRVERQDHKASIFASSEDEAGAKEIVREIVEGQPPE